VRYDDPFHDINDLIDAASDCRQRRPGESFNKKGESAPAKVLDEEYVAFLRDMGEKVPEDKAKKEEKPYVPPMGDLSKVLSKPKAPLMLTNGSAAPGAASAHARQLPSALQAPGGMLQIMGKSIFGGNMTRLTAGYKSHDEIEMERKKKQEEYNNRPVPLEWQVERYEKTTGKKRDDYLERLEREAEVARMRNEAMRAGVASVKPPQMQPGAPTMGQHDDLPAVIGAPLANLRGN